MIQITIRDVVLDREIWDSIRDGHFDEKYKTLPVMIQKIFDAWQKDCFSFYTTHGEQHNDQLIFEFGGYRYCFTDVYWD